MTRNDDDKLKDACRICGWPGALYRHRGSVDYLNDYRAYVEELRTQLPRGKQVMVATIERGASAQVWIDGDITFKGLERLITMIRFMQEAWTEEVAVEPVKTEETPEHETN